MRMLALCFKISLSIILVLGVLYLGTFEMVQLKRVLSFSKQIEKELSPAKAPLSHREARRIMPETVLKLKENYNGFPDEQKRLIDAFYTAAQRYNKHFHRGVPMEARIDGGTSAGCPGDDPFCIEDCSFIFKNKKANGVTIDAYYCDMEITQIAERIAGSAQTNGWEVFFGMGTMFVDTPDGHGCLFQKGKDAVIVTIERERMEKGRVVTVVRSTIE